MATRKTRLPKKRKLAKIKDLDVKRRSRGVKGGDIIAVLIGAKKPPGSTGSKGG
jgi:hypothetical protein